MSILIVDDSLIIREFIQEFLTEGGFADLIMTDSVSAAFEVLGIDSNKPMSSPIELILMDIIMPKIDGLTALKRIMADPRTSEIPVIMITGKIDDESLQSAFDIGASDYVKKPFSQIELVSRVKSVLRLKNEINQNIKLMWELEQANSQLVLLSQRDGLTGLANRRYFDEFIEREWRICKRNKQPLSLILMDIDFFKRYNDTYGHIGGDQCLKKVASVIKQMEKRGGDLAARYGGEEFVVVLANTPSYQAERLAEFYRMKVESMGISHKSSDASDVVTISLGVATVIPTDEYNYKNLIESADTALYQSKEHGRNRVTTALENLC
ncbi:MAG: diguanylate cyclase [Nitrospirae bacterium]|nr:diguanylate cyclase [Nitrospirota bacterium]MBF0540908.1 diguanylate cyclase [Nitrospirota bacterium]